MRGPFRDARVLLGISGSIAAYKAVDLASKLTQAGAIVDVLMTPSAARFVTPLSLRSVTHHPVVVDLFDADSPEAVEHIALATAADVLVAAPATAHLIAKLALGLADDPISLTALATDAPLVIAPAMDALMWDHPAVRHNVDVLIDRGATIVGPNSGRLASGLVGRGRLAETPEILGRIAQTLGAGRDLRGRTIVVSAGGTREPIDPVRVIANRSSGKMGHALAEAARDRGAAVVLITTPTALEGPAGVETMRVETAEEMGRAVHAAAGRADALVMAAAVADYRPAAPSPRKLKRGEGPAPSIDLEPTADIIAGAPADIVRVAFAAESDDLLGNARSKLERKGVDLVVANDVTLPGAGFGADENKVWLIGPGTETELPLMHKYDAAMAILDAVVPLIDARRPTGSP